MSKRRRFPIQTTSLLPDWVGKPERQEPAAPMRQYGDPERCGYQLPSSLIPPALPRKVSCDRTKHSAGKHKASRFIHGHGEVSWEWTH
jgi:hypothetical protein